MSKEQDNVKKGKDENDDDGKSKNTQKCYDCGGPAKLRDGDECPHCQKPTCPRCWFVFADGTLGFGCRIHGNTKLK
jgi:hypothetical protein